jgi:hypothetical protein
MVLLLAMAFAMAAGLLAWGPVPITPADHRFADERASFGLPHFVNVISGLPLLAVSLLGLRATARGTWPSALRAPWLAFFAMCAALSAAGIAYHVDPGDIGFVLTHLFAAGALTTLTLGFLAERVDALFGHVRALAAGCGAVCLAGLWWWVGQWADGSGDLRPLLFLETLPLLLIPAGALGLTGRHTSAVDWLGMLGLYLLSRIAGFADTAVYAATEWISGHTLMHLAWAGVTGWLAYRAVVAPGAERSLTAVLGESTQRSTSLNTSS